MIKQLYLTPKHDEMILWLLNMDNIKSLFKNEIEEIKKPILKFKNNILAELNEEEDLSYQKYFDETPAYLRDKEESGRTITKVN